MTHIPTTKPQKVFIKTFGCQMNVYDSSRMAELLASSSGMQTCDSAEAADVIVFNTCSVREKAEDKVFSDIGRLRALKKNNPQLLIAVGGCVASQEGENIIRRAPEVDVVFGPQTLHRLPAMINKARSEQRPQVDVRFPEIEKFDHLPTPQAHGVTAFVSIMEGCSKYCSFCVVPYTRGEEVSRPFEDILAEVSALATHGVKEITLLGQNVNAYRVDYDGVEADLALLIETIAEIPQIERIRFTTSHPNEMSERLVACFGNVPKLASHLHLPVQAGSDRVLMAMKRNYTTLQYKNTLRKLRRANPLLSISSDFIVGFPGESEADFVETLKLIEDIRFDYSFSFVYSQRPGTPAAFLPDTTPKTLKLERLARLQELNAQHGATYSHAMQGSLQRVLIEEVSEQGNYVGRTDSLRWVDVTSASNILHQCVVVRITDASNPWRLCGEVC